MSICRIDYPSIFLPLNISRAIIGNSSLPNIKGLRAKKSFDTSLLYIEIGYYQNKSITCCVNEKSFLFLNIFSSNFKKYTLKTRYIFPPDFSTESTCFWTYQPKLHAILPNFGLKISTKYSIKVICIAFANVKLNLNIISTIIVLSTYENTKYLHFK